MDKQYTFSMLFKQSGPERKHDILRLFFTVDVCTDVFTSRLPGQCSSQKQEHLSYLFIDSLLILENQNRCEITLEFGILMKGTTNTSASQRRQVR